MNIRQIRNATLIVTFNGTRFLIDPWLLPKEAMPGFDSAVNPHIRQPRCDLPISIEEIVDVEAVVLTHWHPDHIDELALDALRKDIPFFVQSENDRALIEGFRFTDVRILDKSGTPFKGSTLFKTGGQHGRREIIKPICESIGMPYDAMGIIFSAPGEKILYIAGDTIWCPEVKTALDSFHPDAIVVNACAASVASGEKLIMGTEDVSALAEYAKDALIVASHMDTVSHLTVTRADIRALSLSNVIIPEDGDTITP